MFAVVAVEPSGRVSYHAGSREDCALWRLMQCCNALRSHRRSGATPWAPPAMTAVLPREEVEAHLEAGFGVRIALAAGAPLPRWRAYGFDLTTQPDLLPPMVQPFDAVHPNDTGLSDETLMVSAGVGTEGRVGRLAEDWRSHARGTLAVITPNARHITVLYVHAEAP